MIGSILKEWKFLTLLGVLLYGVASINARFEELIEELSSVESTLSQLEIEANSVTLELRDIASELSRLISALSLR